MKLILNPSKPYYLDTEKKIIRCGNFPETGAEIYYENKSFPLLIKKCNTLIEYAELKKESINELKMKELEFDETINYLLKEKFIINDFEYNTLIESQQFNRQDLYFFMLSNKLITNEVLRTKKILILGLGGIGSIVSELLVRAGAENLVLVDFDSVEKSNLIRQLTYSISDVGLLKTEALKKYLLGINKNANFLCINKKIKCSTDIEKEIEASDLVLCTLDKPSRIIRRQVNQACIKYLKPVLFAGFSEHVGMVGPFVIPGETACLGCIEKSNVEEPLNNVVNTPSFGPLCNLIASISASEIINYFLKFKENNLIGSTLMFDMYNYDTHIIKWKRLKNCKKCGGINASK